MKQVDEETYKLYLARMLDDQSEFRLYVNDWTERTDSTTWYGAGVTLAKKKVSVRVDGTTIKLVASYYLNPLVLEA